MKPRPEKPLLLVVDLDGTMYRGDAPVRRYAGWIADSLVPAPARAYLEALERYLESGPAAAADSDDTVEAAVLREAFDPWGAALGLAIRCHGVPVDVTAAAFGRCRRWMTGPECDVELVEPLRQVLTDLRECATIFLVTNSGYGDLRPFLGRLGISGCFDKISAGTGKPDGLRRLLTRTLGPDRRDRPWRAFSVGDHYRNDITPATEIGAGGGYIDRYGRRDGPATATAATAEGLLPALRSWAGDPAGTVLAGTGLAGTARTGG